MANKVAVTGVNGKKPNQLAEHTLDQMRQWETQILTSGGIFPDIFRQLIAVVASLVDPQPNVKKAEEAVASLVITLHNLHELMSPPPLNNPTLDELPLRLQQLDQKPIAEPALDADRVRLQQALEDTLKQLDDARSQLRNTRQDLENERQARQSVLTNLDLCRSAFEKSREALELLGELVQLNCNLRESTLQLEQVALAAPAAFSQAAIDRDRKAVAAWEEWLAAISLRVSDLDSERDELEAELDELRTVLALSDEKSDEDAKLRLSVVEKTLKRLVFQTKQLLELENEGRSRLAALRGRMAAYETLAQPLAENMWEPPSLPGFPEDAGIDPEDTAPSETALSAPGMGRRDTLKSMAQANNLLPGTFFIVTLYDLLPTNTGSSVSQRPCKGIISLLQAAKDAGLLQLFGWHAPKDVMGKWLEGDGRTDPARAFLQYRGKLNNRQIFSRNEDPLPWIPADLLTSEEIEAFRQAVVRRFVPDAK